MKKLRRLLKIIAIMLLMLESGCMSNDIVVDPVQPWEGHYMTVEEFKEKTADIQLESKQSIWVLSNNTLKRVLKNQQNKQK